jgi:hypothetical protein
MARVSLSAAQQRPAVAAAGMGGGGRGGAAAWSGDIIINGARDPHKTANAVIEALQDRGMLPSTLLR